MTERSQEPSLLALSSPLHLVFAPSVSLCYCSSSRAVTLKTFCQWFCLSPPQDWCRPLQAVYFRSVILGLADLSHSFSMLEIDLGKLPFRYSGPPKKAVAQTAVQKRWRIEIPYSDPARLYSLIHHIFNLFKHTNIRSLMEKEH